MSGGGGLLLAAHVIKLDTIKQIVSKNSQATFIIKNWKNYRMNFVFFDE